MRAVLADLTLLGCVVIKVHSKFKLWLERITNPPGPCCIIHTHGIFDFMVLQSVLHAFSLLRARCSPFFSSCLFFFLAFFLHFNSLFNWGLFTAYLVDWKRGKKGPEKIQPRCYTAIMDHFALLRPI